MRISREVISSYRISRFYNLSDLFNMDITIGFSIPCLIQPLTIGGIISKETVCCVGGKVKH